MRHLRLFSTVSILAFAVSLSGCASLQSTWAGIKPGSVTTPQEMQQASFMAEDPIESEAQIEPAIYSPDIATPNIVMEGQMKPVPVKVELEGLITVSAGDTERWTVGDTVSGAGPNEQVHILVKPMASNLSTNAIITSTKRTYYLDLKSFADTYMAAVSWRYPHDAIKQIQKTKPKRSYFKKASFRTADLKLKPEDLRFDYLIKGDTPNWRPTRVFDDGTKTFIQFPKSLAVSEAPPLFVTDSKGKKSKLVNYRVKGEYYVVDRLFDAAELRLGEKDQVVVRIERQS